MASDTKERILDAALTLFSQNGYEGTNLIDIAESVGLVKSGIYRHFSSKEELWDTILSKMEKYYNEEFGSEDNLPTIPTSGEELAEMTMNMVNFTIHDSSVIRVRKLIMIEQFRDERMKLLATRHFLTGIESIFERVFEEMMKNGSLRKDDASMLALVYTAPITSLIHLCDREPEREEEAIQKIKDFIANFIKTYNL